VYHAVHTKSTATIGDFVKEQSRALAMKVLICTDTTIFQIVLFPCTTKDIRNY